MTLDDRFRPSESAWPTADPEPSPRRWRSPQDWLALCDDESAMQPSRHTVRLGAPRRLATLRLRGLSRAELLRVDVLVAGSLAFSLRSDLDGRGGLLAAGDLLEAIAVMFGRQGLVFDVSLPREPASVAEVRLWLSDTARPERVAVDVLA